MLWMGDLETDFMETIEDEIELPSVDIVFAAHHGRSRMPAKWVTEMDPQVIVLGEAPPEHLEYYRRPRPHSPKRDRRHHLREPTR